MPSRVSHSPLTPFGVEIRLDPAGGLNDADKEELCRLFARDGLLVFRDLQLDMDQQIEFCRMFGPVIPGETFIVSNTREDGVFGNTELLFHSDVPYLPAPYWAGSLHAIDVSGDVSATRFASGLRAYERLPPKLRGRVDGLNSIQVRQRLPERRNRLTDAWPGDNCAVQPVVGRQRQTDRPYLFTGAWHTACVIGMSEQESDDLLEELFSYIHAEDAIYDHAWKTGDMVIWDNLAVQHARHAIGGGTRTLQRVSIGDFSAREQFPADRVSAEDLAAYKKLPSTANSATARV